MKGMLSSSWFTTAHLVTAKQHKQILEGPESLSQNPFCVSNFEEKWKKKPTSSEWITHHPGTIHGSLPDLSLWERNPFAGCKLLSWNFHASSF